MNNLKYLIYKISIFNDLFINAKMNNFLNELYQKKDIILIRPGSGLYISLLPHILGKKLNKSVQKGSIVNFSDFSR